MVLIKLVQFGSSRKSSNSFRPFSCNFDLSWVYSVYIDKDWLNVRCPFLSVPCSCTDTFLALKKKKKNLACQYVVFYSFSFFPLKYVTSNLFFAMSSTTVVTWSALLPTFLFHRCFYSKSRLLLGFL